MSVHSLGKNSTSKPIFGESSDAASSMLTAKVVDRCLYGYKLLSLEPHGLFDTLCPDPHFTFSEDAKFVDVLDHPVSSVHLRNRQWDSLVQISNPRLIMTCESDPLAPRFISFMTEELSREYNRRFPNRCSDCLYKFLFAFNRYERLNQIEIMIIGNSVHLMDMTRKTDIHIDFDSSSCAIRFLDEWKR